MTGGIDNPDQVERLPAMLAAALPLSAAMKPELAATLQQRKPDRVLPHGCKVTSISYAGDEDGIVCRLGFGNDDEGGRAVFASIPHLRSYAKLPLARDRGLLDAAWEADPPSRAVSPPRRRYLPCRGCISPTRPCRRHDAYVSTRPLQDCLRG